MSAPSSRLTSGALTVGARCIVGDKRGVILFKGATSFSPGIWVGIQLDTPVGKNDGSVQGVRYFECPPNYGLFVKASMVKVDLGANKQSSPAASDDTDTKSEPASPALSADSDHAADERPVKTLRAPTKGSGIPSSSSLNRIARSGTTAAISPTAAASPTATVITTIASPSVSPSPLTPSPSMSVPVSPAHAAPAASQPASSAAPPVISAPAAETSSLAARRSSLFNLQEKQQQLLQSAPLTIPPQNAQTEKKANAASAVDTSLVAAAAAVVTPTVIPPAPTPAVSVDEHQWVKNELSRAKQTIDQLKAQIAALNKHQSASDAMATELSDLRSMVEMLTLDKSLAEETSEALTVENEALKQQVQALTLDVETLKEEALLLQEEQQAAVISSLTPDQIEMNKIISQNTQLTRALTQLRDLSISEKQNNTKIITNLTNELNQYNNISDELKEYKLNYTKRLSEITELKNALDEASEYEQMVELLSDRNIRITDELSAAQKTVIHLQALCAASEEVEEGHLDLEQQLTKELETKESDLIELTSKLNYKQSQLDESQRSIRQFRDLVRHLENDLKTLREESINKSVNNNNTGRYNNNDNHMITSKRSQVILTERIKELKAAKADAFISRIDSETSRKRAEYIALYLPENVMIDERSLALTLSVDRLRGKAEAVATILNDFYANGSSGNGTESMFSDDVVGSNLSVWSYDCALLLLHIHRITEWMNFAMNVTSVDMFTRAAAAYGDVNNVESAIDTFLQMIARDSLNELTPMTPLIHAHNALAQFALTYLTIYNVNTMQLPSAQSAQNTEALVIPFSIAYLRLLQKYQSDNDNQTHKQRLDTLRQQLTAVESAITQSTDIEYATRLMTVVTDCRQLSFGSFLILTIMQNAGAVLTSVSDALREGRTRRSMADNIERNDVAANGSINHSDFDDDTGNGTEFERDYNDLFDAIKQCAQMSGSLVHTARAYDIALQRSQNNHSSTTHNKRHTADVYRLLYAAELQVYYLTTRIEQLCSALTAVAGPDRLQQIRMDSSLHSTEAITPQLNVIIKDEILTKQNDSIASRLAILKSSIIDLTRKLAIQGDVDGQASPIKGTVSPATHSPSTSIATTPSVPASASTTNTIPSHHHALEIRHQLASSAAIRIQLQELSQRATEKNRELSTLQTRENETLAKMNILQQKIHLLSSRAEQVESIQNDLDLTNKREEELKNKLIQLSEELERVQRESKTFRKQILKLKQSTMKKGDEISMTNALTQSGTTTGTNSGVSGEEVAVLHRAIKMLREELAITRSQASTDTLRAALPPLTLPTTSLSAQSESDRQRLTALRVQCRQLATSLQQTAQTNLRVISIERPLPAAAAAPQQQKPSWQVLQARHANLYQLQSGVWSLQSQLKQYLQQKHVELFRDNTQTSNPLQTTSSSPSSQQDIPTTLPPPTTSTIDVR